MNNDATVFQASQKAIGLIRAAVLLGVAAFSGAAAQGPQAAFGPLLSAVQRQHVFPDGKTFADAEPIERPEAIMKLYTSERPADAAAPRAFVLRHFRLPQNDVRPGLRNHVKAL